MNRNKLIQDILMEIYDQNKIIDAIKSIDELIRLHQEKLELLNQHRKGLVQQLEGKTYAEKLESLKEGLNLSKRNETDMGSGLFYIVLDLLNYSFEDIEWHWDSLAPAEKSIVTRDELAELKDMYDKHKQQ